MGTRNIGYMGEPFDLHPPNLPPPSIPMIPRSVYAINDTPDIDNSGSFPDHTYLAPRVPGYNTEQDILACQKENVYDALGKYSKEDQIRESGEAMKKANLFYQTHEITEQKRPFKHRNKDKKHSCCLPVSIGIIGLLALGAFVVTLLQFFGMLKCGPGMAKSSASSGTTGSSVGSSPSQDPSINLKILELESNITTLKAKMKPQEKELEMLKNQSKEYQRTIQSLQVRLLEEEAKSKSLNSSVAILNDLQASLQLASNQMKVTLSSNITELKEKIKNQELKIDSVDVRPNITSLEIKIDKEIKQRQENDSGLSDKLESQSKLQQTLITNLTNDLATLKQKTNLDIWNFHNVLSVAINNSIKARKQSDEKLLSRINYLNTTLLNQVKNISLTPGPKGPMGPSGAGNLSRCTHQRRAVQGIGTSLHYVVLVVPPDSNPWVLLGVFCSSNIASSNTYETDRRKCRCTASVRQSFFCYSDSWWCPLMS